MGGKSVALLVVAMIDKNVDVSVTGRLVDVPSVVADGGSVVGVVSASIRDVEKSNKSHVALVVRTASNWRPSLNRGRLVVVTPPNTDESDVTPILNERVENSTVDEQLPFTNTDGKL
jgi:hypothetical protein